MVIFRYSQAGECLIADGFDNYVSLTLQVLSEHLIVTREQKIKILKSVVETQEENKRLLAYIKDLHARGICSTASIAEKCGIPYKEVSSWYNEQAPKKGKTNDKN